MPFWKLHNWNGYLAMSMAVLHPTILLFSPRTAAIPAWSSLAAGQFAGSDVL